MKKTKTEPVLFYEDLAAINSLHGSWQRQAGHIQSIINAFNDLNLDYQLEQKDLRELISKATFPQSVMMRSIDTKVNGIELENSFFLKNLKNPVGYDRFVDAQITYSKAVRHPLNLDNFLIENNSVAQSPKFLEQVEGHRYYAETETEIEVLEAYNTFIESWQKLSELRKGRVRFDADSLNRIYFQFSNNGTATIRPTILKD